MAKCLTPAVNQYYQRCISTIKIVCLQIFSIRYGLEGLTTDQARLAVLKWIDRSKSMDRPMDKLQDKSEDKSEK